MNVLFLHQNYPAQFVHLAGYLGQAGHAVVGLSQRRNRAPEGTRLIEYKPAPAADRNGVHSYLNEVDAAVRNAEGVARACERLEREGFVPDIVVGHTGWGETLYVKDIWPSVPVLGYFEYYYRPTGADADFDPEFPADDDIAMRLRTRNAVSLLSMDAVDWGLTPTRWQHERHPEHFRERISIIHEGVDTGLVHPDPTARLWLSGGRSFQYGDEVVTFASRSLEPYRGFHVFMRALPELMRRRPNAHFLVVGDDGVSYGFPPPDGRRWREALLDELDGQLDLARLHFLGPLCYDQYLTVLRVSAAHVYLSYPFVLSWSLLESMSTGCRVVASRTAPVEEVVEHDHNGHLVDFFDAPALAERVCDALNDRSAPHPLRTAARETIRTRYDLRTNCLPSHLTLLRTVSGGSPGAPVGAARQRGCSRTNHQQSEGDADMAYMPPYAILKDGLGRTPDNELVIMSRDLFRLFTEALARAAGFDVAWYRAHNPDVADAVARGEIADEFEHFVSFGYEEGRVPADQEVDEAWYRQAHGDVDQAIAGGGHESGETHYHDIGYFEGRPANAAREIEVSRWMTAIARSRERLDQAGGALAMTAANEDDTFLDETGLEDTFLDETGTRLSASPVGR
jgi:glycosyltransferase involved in cell wall biosynthesis